MNELLEIYGLLAAAVLDDPLLALANAVVWLDPLWQTRDDEYDEEDGLGMALGITRSVFPDIYVDVVERLRSGASEKELYHFICGEISQRGIPLDDLEYIGWGIPLMACGVDLSSPELYASHPDLLPLVDLFGIRPEAGQYSVEIPDSAYTVGRLIADSLVQQDEDDLKQVGWALAWLFSCSGNSLIDCDDEALAEIPPLPWDEENLAFAIDLIAEADGIITDVTAGLKLLEENPAYLAALSAKVKHVSKIIAKQKGKNHESRIRLEWASPVAGPVGTTVINPEFLQFRGDDA